MLAAFALACTLPPPDRTGGESGVVESDADTDTDSDSDIDVDTDTDTNEDPGAYTGPPRVIMAASDIWKDRGEWALFDLESLEWLRHGEAVDGNDLQPVCSAAWVGVVARNGAEGDSLELDDARYGTSLATIDLDLGSQPRAAVGAAKGAVAIGYGVGHRIEIREPDGDLVATVNLAELADGSGTAIVSALTWWNGSLVAVIDAGALTQTTVALIDPETWSITDTFALDTADVSDEVAVVDDVLYVFGRGDPLHPAAIDALYLSNGFVGRLDAKELGKASITAASFAADGFWVATVDAKGTAGARWLQYDGTVAHGFDSYLPIGDIAAESSAVVWLTELDGGTVRRRDSTGKALGAYVLDDPVAIRVCGAERL